MASTCPFVNSSRRQYFFVRAACLRRIMQPTFTNCSFSGPSSTYHRHRSNTADSRLQVRRVLTIAVATKTRHNICTCPRCQSLGTPVALYYTSLQQETSASALPCHPLLSPSFTPGPSYTFLFAIKLPSATTQAGVDQWAHCLSHANSNRVAFCRTIVQMYMRSPLYQEPDLRHESLLVCSSCRNNSSSTITRALGRTTGFRGCPSPADMSQLSSASRTCNAMPDMGYTNPLPTLFMRSFCGK